MFVLKCILGFVIGAVVGFIAGSFLGVPFWIFGSKEAHGAVALLLSVAGAIGGLYLVYDHERATNRMRAAAVERRETHLNELVSETHAAISDLPGLLSSAEQHLDNAEKEFFDGVFAPFWDEIEKAISKLAMYYRQVRIIRDFVAEFKEVETPIPPESSRALALPNLRIPDARDCADRLTRIVRRAQKDHKFAQIYEQRRTNKILVEGFDTLGTAIYEIRDDISDAIADLSTRLQISVDQRTREIAADADERRKFEKDAIEMLDNIQRRKKPFP